MTDTLREKLDFARWELGNFEQASNLSVKKSCLCFAIGYLNEMVEMIDEQQKNEIDAMLNDLSGEIK